MTRRRGAAVALGVAMAAVVEPGRRVRAQQPDLLYVCVQDDAKIAVVDMASRAVLRTIDLVKLGFPATAKPHFVAVEPDGQHWYVSLIGANRVVKFDRSDRIVAHSRWRRPGCWRSPAPTRSW